MKSKFLLFCVTFIMVFGTGSIVRASSILLEIDDNFVATPGSTLQVPATITNLGSSDITFAELIIDAFGNRVESPGDTFSGASFGPTFPSSDPLFPLFSFFFGPTTSNSSIPFELQFSNIDIAPGTAFDFIAGTIVLNQAFPIGSTLDSLQYSFSTRTVSSPPVSEFSNVETFTVSIVPVPEPYTILLLGFSLIILLMCNSKHRKRGEAVCPNLQ